MDSPRVSLGPKILVTEGAKHVRDGTESPERKPEQQVNRNKRHEAQGRAHVMRRRRRATRPLAFRLPTYSPWATQSMRMAA